MARSLLLFAATCLFLAALTGYQATGTSAGERLLGRLFAALVEVDRWLPAHQEDLTTAAMDTTRSRVSLPDFPIPVSVTAAAAGDGEALRSAIVATAGTTLYRDGRDAFRAETDVGGSLALDEPARWTIDLLGESAHGFWIAALAVATVLGGVLFAAAALTARQEGWRPILLPIAAAGALFGAVTLVGRLVFTLAANGAASIVDEEVALIWRDVAWIGTRAGLAALVVALALISLAHLLGEGGRREAEPWPGALDEPF